MGMGVLLHLLLPLEQQWQQERSFRRTQLPSRCHDLRGELHRKLRTISYVELLLQCWKGPGLSFLLRFTVWLSNATACSQDTEQSPPTHSSEQP